MEPIAHAAVPTLTSLAHGGGCGCGCKIAPGVLADLLKRDARVARPFADLLVGTETADDAAVYRLNDRQAIVATTDFFMPIVDDPFDFGRIAATNALSDVYAMGGTPILALAIVGMPVNVLPHATIARILEGGEAVCADAGIPVAGGHSIDSVEPIYGLAALGLVDPDRVMRNSGALAGDVLILGKPLGVGILSAAFKKQRLDDAGYRALIATTTRLNRPGAALATLDGVHAMTDVTGFGLLGHTLEMCRGAKLGASIDYAALRWIDGAVAHADAGILTGASTRNWASYGDAVDLAASLPRSAQTLLTDPQTSGGLLVACDRHAAERVLEVLRGEGFGDAAVIGAITDGPPRIHVR
ncbi:selenide, water dikinase SelD [Pararobbsia silviterrae]|uniref:Selenide, water dikinase n=1 Tax=Pararobbsia silviterrae TaxID=1792498 RepID=A0A494XG53_9BURK|nr:selenide, water dikinase SelD [Pararobbsia silviterrae]RKP46573.1 selenide, water dikinase SelD [Pararobbsia silviterrae]